ncbi:WG repeat-containing protein [Streptomyces sp. NBC_01343]|uniref:WG repeat-containing protein n=1 Tax=Streptomyces sp. NBC_01343 TaxID=2903832 RepID=UPI002E1420C3|nr:WG repeat-containing protein [Streptomyces sp. NBC_01343]
MPPISASGTGSYRLIRSDRAHCFDDVFVRPASRTAWRPVAYRLSPQHPTHAGCREGVAAARTDERVGFSDTSGGFAIRPQYAAAGSFAPNGLAGVRMADGGRCGYVDRTGRTVIGPRFDGAKPFGRHGAVPVRVGDLWGLIDENGEWTVEPSFPMLGPFDANGLACVLGGSAGNHFRGFPNARGEAVIEAENRLSQDFRCGLVRFDDGYAHGYLDATGAEVIEQCREWAEDSDSAPGPDSPPSSPVTAASPMWTATASTSARSCPPRTAPPCARWTRPERPCWETTAAASPVVSSPAR